MMVRGFGMAWPMVIFGVQNEPMDILLIGKGEGSLPNLEKALQKMGHRVQRPADGTGTEGWDSVILDPGADPADPELVWSQAKGLTIQSLAEFLYGHAKEKTRVVIAGGPGRDEILFMILHVLEYHGVEVDHYLRDGAKAGSRE